MKADSISPPQKSIFTPFIQVSPSVPRLFSNWKVKKKKNCWKPIGKCFQSCATYMRNVDLRKERKKRFMKRSLNVSVGFKLLLWCSVDLCLITFRCWLPWIWVEDGRRGVEVLAGSWVGDYFTHTHAHLDMHIRALALTYSALSSFLLSGSILTLQFARLPCVWKNRATFVPTFQMVSCGRLQCPYDCTVCRG